MKKLLTCLTVTLLAAGSLFAASPFDEFRNKIVGLATAEAQKNLDNFAKDLGGVIGGGAAHQGKALGFPGFDIGIHITGKNTASDNVIVKSAGLDTMAFPVLQAEIGLPSKIDLIGRFVTYSGSSLVGVGARYGLLKEDIPLFPSISVQAVYNSLNVASDLNKFKATTISAAGVISFNIPIVDPYVLVGVDSTSIDPDSTITDLKGNASGYRAEVGLNLSLVPFTYLQVAGGYINGDVGYNLGLGIKF